MIEVTTLRCPGRMNNETHHLVPVTVAKYERMVCAYCHRSEKTLREEAEEQDA